MDKKYNDFEVLNLKRSALVLKRKQPFYNWLESIDPGSSVEDDFEPDVYLLPDFEGVSHMENWIKRNFELIFEQQLNDWYVEEDLWVQNRTYKMFREWFEYTLHPMVYDLEVGPIEKI